MSRVCIPAAFTIYVRGGGGMFKKGGHSMGHGKSYEQYTVSIASVPLSPRPPVPHNVSTASMQTRSNRAAMEANRAVWGYTKVALLFFVSLLITWVGCGSAFPRTLRNSHLIKFQ